MCPSRNLRRRPCDCSALDSKHGVRGDVPLSFCSTSRDSHHNSYQQQTAAATRSCNAIPFAETFHGHDDTPGKHSCGVCRKTIQLAWRICRRPSRQREESLVLTELPAFQSGHWHHVYLRGVLTATALSWPYAFLAWARLTGKLTRLFHRPINALANMQLKYRYMNATVPSLQARSPWWAQSHELPGLHGTSRGRE